MFIKGYESMTSGKIGTFLLDISLSHLDGNYPLRTSIGLGVQQIGHRMDCLNLKLGLVQLTMPMACNRN